jgi:membrane-associated phospholipid phosphatase
MYRCMHHPLDVASGVLIGLGSLLVALLATRASGLAVLERQREDGGTRR